MNDKENVITHLQIIRTWAAFAREYDLQFFTAKHLEDIVAWTDDAIDLLKKQGKQKFLLDEKGHITPLPAVIRCKECKSSFEKDGKTYCGTILSNKYALVDPEWFCADGEKRE